MKCCTSTGLFYGAPVDIILGEAILLGPVCFLLLKQFRLLTKLLVAATLFFIVQSYADFTRTFSSLSAAIRIVMGVIPAILLAEWTAKDKRIYLRTLLQSLSWMILLLWLFPAMLFQQAHGSWGVFLHRSLPAN